MRDAFRTGEVVSTSPENATVRVKFQDTDDLVSYDLQMLFHKTHKDKFYFMPDIGDLVACIFLGNGPEAGYVLGAVYNGKDKPPVESQDKYHATFEDGTVLEYDRKEHKLIMLVNGDITIKAGGTIKINAAHVGIQE